jgi:hypothetical protein
VIRSIVRDADRERRPVPVSILMGVIKSAAVSNENESGRKYELSSSRLLTRAVQHSEPRP